jgi:uncharacterized protein (TIGR02246 family)
VSAIGIVAVAAAGFVFAQNKADVTPKTDSDRPDDRAAIRQTMNGFAAAFEKGDAAAAAAFLTAGAELIPDDAPAIRGRDAVQKAFADHFAKVPKCKVTLEPESLRFTSRDTAIEEGNIKVAREKAETSYNRYSVLLVREDGKWLLGYIKEWPDEDADLKDLDWLIGTWTSKRPDLEIQTKYEWFGNKTFIKGQITVRGKEKNFTGMQMIGIDPGTGDLHYWTFEHDGGVGEGTIKQEGKKWVFDSTMTLSDGSILEANYLMIQIDKDTFTWQPINLVLDGEQLGNDAPAKVTRVKTKD